MTYRIGLRFEDGATKIIACRPKETLVDAAMRQGVSLPIDCREGACGTCRCLVESGAVDLGDYVEDALSEVDVAQGWALACQARPTSDCVFHVPASSAVCQSKPSTIEARLTSIDKLGTKVMSITVEGPAIEALEYMPGQYAKVFLPDGSAQRAYSFSSMKTDETKLSFLIRLVPEGQMSTWLETEAKVGDKLAFQGPFGSFYLRPIQRPILMLAGGTGLGPMLAMLESLEAMGRLQQPCHLMLGVNDDDDAQMQMLLNDWGRRLPGFSWKLCVADRVSSHPFKGYVTDHLNKSVLHDGNVDIYVCGPPPMVDAVNSWLKRENVTPVALHYERFLVSN